MKDQQPRARLLAAAVEYAEDHGLSDVSLRELATAIGTSHRMLIYHFGSKEGLLVAVIQAVEDAQRALLSELAADPTISTAEVMRTMWRRLSHARLWPRERLFFEVYGQALQGRPGTVGLLEGIVDSWVEPIAGFLIERGVPRSTARTEARLGVAVARGLLLDLLATGDRRAVDRAAECYIAQFDDNRVSDDRQP